MENNQSRNFYEEEAHYEKSTELIKELIKKVISIDMNLFKQKIDYLNDNSKYAEFIDLFLAVLGKKTNKYYYCESEDDVKYHNLILGEVYKVSELTDDLKNKDIEEKTLKLQARSILSKKLLLLTNELKQSFALNIGMKDSSMITLESHIIKESDIEYLNNLIKYLETLIDKTGRLKILLAEKDVYALKEAEETYNKKSSIEKMFYKAIKQEKNIINLMTNKNKLKK